MTKVQLDILMLDAQRAAETGQPTAPFWICGPKGILRAEWLDPHFGFIAIDGQDDAFMKKDIEANPAVLFARTEDDAKSNQAALAALANQISDLLADHT